MADALVGATHRVTSLTAARKLFLDRGGYPKGDSVVYTLPCCPELPDSGVVLARLVANRTTAVMPNGSEGSCWSWRCPVLSSWSVSRCRRDPRCGIGDLACAPLPLWVARFLVVSGRLEKLKPAPRMRVTFGLSRCVPPSLMDEGLAVEPRGLVPPS